jgi:Ca-activated chloride channel homolog
MRAIPIVKYGALTLAILLVAPRVDNVARAQSTPRIHVEVDMVQLNVAGTDSKGDYVTGLHPWDFTIQEDGITQKLATYSEGNEPVRRVGDIPKEDSNPKLTPPSYRKKGMATTGGSEMANALAGANVYILFDKSDYMYRGFVYAQDAISDFIRSLEGPDRIAFYSYSRDLSRDAQLTPDRFSVLRGVRATTAGDSAALYNALLMTLKDARQVTGRKVVVVFSNGPDNASMVAPEDVGELAQSEGVPIYMISTREARSDPASTVVFERMAAATGGKAYFANNWRDQQKAFASIRDDLAHLYSLSYYPQSSQNRGWRAITVKLNGPALKKYRVRTRSGYRPLPTRTLAENNASAAQ